MSPAIDGTQERLDAILAELRAMRAELTTLKAPKPPEGQVALSEPAKPKRK